MKMENMIRLLHELVKNSKRSDRDIAKTLQISQPTITRTRKRLEKMGYIQEYTVIPNMTKLGFEIAAFTFLNIARYDIKTGEKNREIAEKAHEWIKTNPRIMLAAGGDGLNGKNCMMVSLHRDFTDYTEFISDFRTRWAANIKDIDGFLVPLRGMMPKRFSFKYIEGIK